MPYLIGSQSICKFPFSKELIFDFYSDPNKDIVPEFRKYKDMGSECNECSKENSKTMTDVKNFFTNYFNK